MHMSAIISCLCRGTAIAASKTKDNELALKYFKSVLKADVRHSSRIEFFAHPWSAQASRARNAMPNDVFYSIHRQGFVRVAACTPRIHVGDPNSNAEETLALMRDGEARHVDLMLFPELGLSAYAIDDLLLQDALLDGVERRDRRLARPRARCVRLHRGRAGAAQPPALQLRRGHRARPDPRRGAEVVPAQLPRVLREPLVRAGRGRRRASRSRSPGSARPSAPTSLFAASDLPDFTFHVEICEDFWAATPPSTRGALAGAPILCQPLGVERRDRQGRGARDALRLAVDALPGGVRLLGLGPGREHHRPRVGRAGDRSTSWARCSRAPSAFPSTRQMAVADVDVERLRQERMRTATFNAPRPRRGTPRRSFRRVAFEHERAAPRTWGSSARSTAFPSCPTTPRGSTTIATRPSTSRCRACASAWRSPTASAS